MAFLIPSTFGEIFDSCMSTICFESVHRLLDKFMERNMSNNFTAYFHASTVATLSFTQLMTEDKLLYYLLKKFSTGYFLYDLRQILKYNKLSLMNAAYLYHHLASIYFLHNAPADMGSQVMFWSELSNIPSYFVYFLMKQKNKNGEKLRLLEKIQFYLFLIIRFPILTYMAYDTVKAGKEKPVYPIIPIYLMGLVWTYKLGKKL